MRYCRFHDIVAHLSISLSDIDACDPVYSCDAFNLLSSSKAKLSYSSGGFPRGDNESFLTSLTLSDIASLLSDPEL